jgi:hypothetical protein
MSRVTQFTLRICTTHTLGLLPFLVNLLVNVMVGTLTYYSVLHVSDLMYFSLTICGVTLFDLFVDGRDRCSFTRPTVFDLISIYAILVLLIVATLFLGLSLYYVAEPPASGPYEPQMHRLVTGSLFVAAFALVFSLFVEVRLCFPKHPSSPPS